MVTISFKQPLGDAEFQLAVNEATDEWEIALDNGCEGYGCTITREQVEAIHKAIGYMLNTRNQQQENREQCPMTQ